jgi:putative transposase
MAPPIRKTPRLRFGRLSVPKAHYFVTFCTKDRVRALIEPKNAAATLGVLHSMHEATDIEWFTATIMPDHVHLLFALGERLEVGQVIGKIKTLSHRQSQGDWRWQTESFEHHLRPGESLGNYGFYIFMNPYRAGLCRLDERWPWWVCSRPADFRFLSLLGEGQAVPGEWIGRSREIARQIVVRSR